MSKTRIVYLITILLVLTIACVMLITLVNTAFDKRYEAIGIENAINQMENEVDEELVVEYKLAQNLVLAINVIIIITNILIGFITIRHQIKKEKEID